MIHVTAVRSMNDFLKSLAGPVQGLCGAAAMEVFHRIRLFSLTLIYVDKSYFTSDRACGTAAFFLIPSSAMIVVTYPGKGAKHRKEGFP